MRPFFLTLISVPALAALLTGAQTTPAESQEENAPGAQTGQELFVAYKCNLCHTVEKMEIERISKSDKMRAKDLSNVGTEHDAAWIVQFLKKEVQLDEKEHKRSFKGTDDELEQIAEWIATLKTEDSNK